MADPTYLFEAFDRGTITRRQLLQALGLAAVGLPLARALGQGQCAGRDRDTTAACIKTPAKAPFAPTGWKTVLLDHFHMRATDAEREAAFYAAFLGWKVRSNDGNEIHMDIGDLGGVKIVGGYTPPPRGANGGFNGGRGGGGGGRAGGGADSANTRRGGDSASGRANGRGGGGNAANANPSNMPACTTPRGAPIPGAGVVWDGFCFGIDKWDTKKVEAELAKRSLNPVADHDPKADFYSFHVKDPDGMDLQISNGNRKNRRRTPAKGTLNVPLPFEPTGYQTVYLDHISYRVTSYKDTVAFYAALLGWRGLGDEGSQEETLIAPDIGGLLIRGGNSMSPQFQMPATRTSQMDHISFGITPFDPDEVNAALCKRGLQAQVDTGAIASSSDREHDIHTATYKSFHTRTPNNFNLQFSAKISSDMKTGPG
jgi:catechol 2,3-dioxygenase-like lactoylglutathione lyase family enzyme